MRVRINTVHLNPEVAPIISMQGGGRPIEHMILSNEYVLDLDVRFFGDELERAGIVSLHDLRDRIQSAVAVAFRPTGVPTAPEVIEAFRGRRIDL